MLTSFDVDLKSQARRIWMWIPGQSGIFWSISWSQSISCVSVQHARIGGSSSCCLTRPWGRPHIIIELLKTRCRIQSVVDKEISFEIRFDDFPWRRTMFSSCSHGWLVSNEHNPICLLNPFSRLHLQLPTSERTPSSFLYVVSSDDFRLCPSCARR